MAFSASMSFTCPTSGHAAQQVIGMQQELGNTALFQLACGCQMPGTAISTQTTTDVTTGAAGRDFPKGKKLKDHKA